VGKKILLDKLQVHKLQDNGTDKQDHGKAQDAAAFLSLLQGPAIPFQC
jgi:hypothetical protein